MFEFLCERCVFGFEIYYEVAESFDGFDSLLQESRFTLSSFPTEETIHIEDKFGTFRLDGRPTTHGESATECVGRQ